MMRNFFWSVLVIFWPVALFGQKADILKAFEKYGIHQASVDSLNEHHYLHYSFNLKTTVVTTGSEKTYIAAYDPAKPEDARWALNSVNGGSPSRLDLNTFNKQHSEKIPPAIPDYNTGKVVRDDGKELVISYHYDPASLVADNGFMEACVVTLYFNAQTGRIIRAESEIAESFKVKMFKGDHLSTNTTYQYAEDRKRYLLLREEVSISLRILGRPVEMITINEYSGYKKM